MEERSHREQAVELLQELGLNEYEARSFVALARVPRGTAKEISEISDVPRTRVYDAVRVLEEKGLVEIQHSNPQEFRAVSVAEAAETLRGEFESRTDSLEQLLASLEPATVEDDTRTHEVWSLSGSTAIANRTQQLIGDADEEVVLVIGDEGVLDEELVRTLAGISPDVSMIVGTPSEAIRDTLGASLSEATIFVSGLEWLGAVDETTDATIISRLLLIDRQSILVSTRQGPTGVEGDEQAVFGYGFDNGFVTLVRRLMATGLIPRQDPGSD